MTPLQASRAIRDLTKVPSQSARPVSVRIKADIERYFSAGEDPYGKAWAPLRPATLAKGRHPPPLTDTHDGRDGITVTPAQGAGVRITSNTSYMVHHMRKSGNRAARKFLPEGVTPKQWEKIYQEELEKASRKVLSGLGT